MKPTTRQFNKVAASTLQDSAVQSSLRGLYDGFHRARENAARATDDWEDMRDRARAIKAHTMDNLDLYLGVCPRNNVLSDMRH